MKPINLHEVRLQMAEFIKSGTIDERVLNVLMTTEGFVPKESELWDYKLTANRDSLSKAKTVMQILSFYNAYGGYIVYGVDEENSNERYIAKGVAANCLDQQQIRMLIKEYTGESIDFSYREILVSHGSANLLFGIMHIPKRPTNHPPVFFAKNGPDYKPGSPLFQKDQAYLRLQDNCVPAKDKKALQFLFGPRQLETDFSEGRLRLFAPREVILDHNLPDRNVICSRFFGRDEIIERLWLWLSDEFSTTRVLAGDGGRGKTSIAYEFCEEVCRARPFELARVYWVTAKQKQFSGMRNEYLQMPETHFNDLSSLLRALCIGYAMLEQEVDEVAPRFLRKSLQTALRLFPSLVVIDDIDSVDNLDEQKRILELCSAVSAGTPSRFLLTTRMNLTSSSDVCLRVPGLGREEYKPYLDYLIKEINAPPIGKKDFDLLWNATDGSPLFTESVLRLFKLGIPLHKAITNWKGKLGEEVRMAALHREIQKLSPEARRVLLACAYMGGASTVELKQVTGYDDARMTACITELTSLFLLSSPEFIKKVPRFQVPSNTARLVIETEKELVAEPERLKKTVQNLRGKTRLQKSGRVSAAVSQGKALIREGRFDDAIKTLAVAVEQLGDHPDLLMMGGRTYFIKAREQGDAAANTSARKLFKRAYDRGQRDHYLFECWFQSELQADHPSGALEVAEIALKDGVEVTSEWRLRKAQSLHKLALKHIQSNNPHEAISELERCAHDVSLALAESYESRFEQDTLRAALNRINDDRIELVSRTAGNFADWEKVIETIAAIVYAGDTRWLHANRAVEAFSKMVQSIALQNIQHEIHPRRTVPKLNEDIGPRKHHLAAVYNRRRDISLILQRVKFRARSDRQRLEDKVKMMLSSFEGDRS